MKTTLRIFQPWAALLVLLCGCLSAFGQSSSRFNVTVTESSAGACKKPPCLHLLDWPSDFSNNCISTENEDTMNATTTDTDFDFTFQMPITNQTISTNNFGISGRVYGRDANNQFVPLALPRPGQLTTYTSIGSTGSINSNDELTLNINMDFIDPGYCEIYFSFNVYQIVPLGSTLDVEFEIDDLYLEKCSCGTNSQNGGNNQTRNNRTKSPGFNPNSLVLFPNPVNANSLLVKTDLSGLSQSKDNLAEISIFTLQGQKVFFEENLPLQPNGELNKKLDVSKLAPGVYMLELRYGSYREIRKFVRQ